MWLSGHDPPPEIRRGPVPANRPHARSSARYRRSGYQSVAHAGRNRRPGHRCRIEIFARWTNSVHPGDTPKRISPRPADAGRGEMRVDLRSSFSNPRKPLGSLISRVLRGSRTRRPRNRAARITDQRGPVRENSRQSQTRLSVSNRAELLAGYTAGVPVRELATRFKLHRGTVREIARLAGLAARQPELPDAIRHDAAQLYP